MNEEKRATRTIYDSAGEELARKTVRMFYDRLAGLSDEFETVVVSLSGGRSVQRFYRLIPEYADRLSREVWKSVHFFWTDERLVPPDSSESNYKLARDLFLLELIQQGDLDRANVHSFPGDTSSPEVALKNYSAELTRVSDGVVHLPILGVGGDGHIGSLFPGRPQLDDRESEFVLVRDAPKPPDRRISLAPSAIRRSINPTLFFLGEEKLGAYECFRDNDRTYRDCPCKLALAGSEGDCYVITDLQNPD